MNEKVNEKTKKERKPRTAVDYSQVETKPHIKKAVLIHNVKVNSGQAHNTIRVSGDARDSLMAIVEDRTQKIVSEITTELMGRCNEINSKTVTKDMLNDMLIIAKFTDEQIATATTTLKGLGLFSQENLKRLLESGKLEVHGTSETLE